MIDEKKTEVSNYSWVVESHGLFVTGLATLAGNQQ